MSTKKWVCSCMKSMTNKSVSFEGGMVFLLFVFTDSSSSLARWWHNRLLCFFQPRLGYILFSLYLVKKMEYSRPAV